MANNTIDQKKKKLIELIKKKEDLIVIQFSEGSSDDLYQEILDLDNEIAKLRSQIKDAEEELNAR